MENQNDLTIQTSIQVKEAGDLRVVSLWKGAVLRGEMTLKLNADRDLESFGFASRTSLVDEMQLPDDETDLNYLLQEVYKVARIEKAEQLIVAASKQHIPHFQKMGFEAFGQSLYIPRRGWTELFALSLKSPSHSGCAGSPFRDLCRFYDGMESLSEILHPSLLLSL